MNSCHCSEKSGRRRNIAINEMRQECVTVGVAVSRLIIFLQWEREGGIFAVLTSMLFVTRLSTSQHPMKLMPADGQLHFQCDAG